MAVGVMVVERYRFVRDALRVAIGTVPGLELVADASNVQDAMAFAAELEPDVILLDVDWPSLDGLAAAPVLRRTVPEACIVMYSSDPEFERIDTDVQASSAAMAAGADAYLTADSTLEQMLDLLERVSSPLERGAYPDERLLTAELMR